MQIKKARIWHQEMTDANKKIRMWYHNMKGAWQVGVR